MASHQRGKYLRPQLRHLQLRQPLPYSTSSPYCLPCPTAAQTSLPPQLARPTATTVTPSWAQRGHYFTSSPSYCPPAAGLALKLATTAATALLSPQPHCPPSPTVSPCPDPEDTTSPAPPLLMPQALYFPAPAPAGQPFCYSSTPVLPHYSTTPPLSLPYIPATAKVSMSRP